MAFVFPQKVLFKHCDPAGIVFYPRYFEMMNDCVEAFFDRALGTPFEDLHKTGAVPTAQIETRFAAPSRHGDQLTLRLSITRVGRASASYHLTAHCRDALRFETTATLVHVAQTGVPIGWPDALRQKLLDHEDAAP